MNEDRGLEHVGLTKMDGPLIVVDKVRDVAYDELVEVRGPSGETRVGMVLEVNEDTAVVQVLEGTEGLTNASTRVRFLGHPLSIHVTREMLGRMFNGLGKPIDGSPAPRGGDLRDINGEPINPYMREYPRDFIQTGMSSIDALNSLVRGQKLPIFSGNGMPHDRLAAQIVRQAQLIEAEVEFVIVFAAMGVKNDVAQFFYRSFEESGVLSRVAFFLSLADDPSIERLLTPRTALTAAEHFAFDLDMHVLVVMTDMTNYAESLREIGTSRGEIPARKGYPGYLYSDLAQIYERAGRIKDSKGSITQMPVLTMPSDDISHPVPDLTGYITEGQIVMDRELFQKGVYPPVAGLPSLSRLMKDGIGKDRTRPDHPDLASQLFAAYSHVKQVRGLAAVIGEEELSPLDKQYMQFGERFERELVSQREDENRSIEQTLEIGWDIISLLPKSELYRLSEEQLKEHYREEKGEEISRDKSSGESEESEPDSSGKSKNSGDSEEKK